MDSSVFSTIRSRVPCRTSDLLSPICSPVGSQQILCAQFQLNVNRKSLDRLKCIVRLSRKTLGDSLSLVNDSKFPGCGRMTGYTEVIGPLRVRGLGRMQF